MKRYITVFIASIFVAAMFLSAGCGKNKESKPQGDTNYSDSFQSAAQVDYEDLAVQVRTSSAAYFTGSIISVTAVIENKSENYYLVSPQGNGFDITVSADGYEFVPSGAASPSDIPLVLEPFGSVSMTKEYKSRVNVNGEEIPAWECEPAAVAFVRISKPAVSRQSALEMPLSEEKSAKTSFMMYGTGEKP